MSFSIDEEARRHAKALSADRLLDKVHMYETLIPTLEATLPNTNDRNVLAGSRRAE
jgi:hypothetical protein